MRRPLAHRVIEWLAAWYDADADEQRARALDASVRRSHLAVAKADAAIAARRKVRSDFRRMDSHFAERE